MPGCSNRRNGHEFPRHAATRKQWIYAVRRVADKRGKPWLPSAYSVVCDAHFLPADYISVTQTGTYALNVCTW